MTEEQAFALADPDGGVYVPGRVPARARHAEGRDRASPRRFVPATAWAGTSTTTTCSPAPTSSSAPATRQPRDLWIPALDGVAARLRPAAPSPTSAAARRLDDPDGAGLPGPRSPAPTTTRDRSRPPQAGGGAGVADRSGFEAAAADGFPGTGYDLVAIFDCLHDMGDPVAAAGTSARRSPDGSWLIVEPSRPTTRPPTSIPSAASTTTPPPSCACPNALQPGGSPWARRPARRPSGG